MFPIPAVPRGDDDPPPQAQPRRLLGTRPARSGHNSLLFRPHVSFGGRGSVSTMFFLFPSYTDADTHIWSATFHG